MTLSSGYLPYGMIKNALLLNIIQMTFFIKMKLPQISGPKEMPYHKHPKLCSFMRFLSPRLSTKSEASSYKSTLIRILGIASAYRKLSHARSILCGPNAYKGQMTPLSLLSTVGYLLVNFQFFNEGKCFTKIRKTDEKPENIYIS